MAQADRVYTPTDAPIDTTRRRFLIIAAVGSVVGVASLIGAMLAPSVPSAMSPAQPCARHNRAPIAIMVADEIMRLGSAVRS